MMEGNQEDPLIVSDEESGCGSEVDTASCMAALPGRSIHLIVTLQEKLHFIVTASLIAISTSVVVIILPLYIESVNVTSDIYCSFLFTGATGAILLTILSVTCHVFSKNVKSQLNVPYLRVVRVGIMKGVASGIVLFAMDRKRVLCHLQDPILGLGVAFSLSFYFLFCEKVMGLQRIFSAMVIIVGVFISVDYQLCNEFRCHGNERMANTTPVPEHTSAWAWGNHLAWAFICAVGLALWALAYALLENDVIKFKTHDLPSLLATVSRIVATRELDSSSPLLLTSHSKITNSKPESNYLSKSGGQTFENDKEKRQLPWYEAVLGTLKCSLFLAASLVTAQLTTLIFFAWVAMFRPLGKASSLQEWWNLLLSGLLCHFSSVSNDCCSGVALYGWIFAIGYSIMIVSSVHFLFLSESSLFTIACSSVALPVTGIWWSFFSSRNATLAWEPVLTGELICSLLGLPVILAGLGMLCRTHWEETKLLKLSPSFPATQTL